MNIFQTFLRTKSIRWVAVLYVFVTLALSQIPLFNYLGYEFSAVIGIAAGLLAGVLTISLFRKRFGSTTSLSRDESVFFAADALIINVALLLIPLILISFNAFFVKNCSFINSLAFFLLIPVVTILFAVALGMCASIWFHHSYLMYTIFFLIILLHPIYLTLTSPQLFAYNLFFGYFPGFTYDEVLRMTRPFLLFRAVTIVAAATIFFLTVLVVEHTHRAESLYKKLEALRHLFRMNWESVVALVGLVFLVGVYTFRNELGFESSAAFIQRQLGSSYTTPNFHIYYSSNEVTPQHIKWIAAEHEFRYQQVNRIFRTDLRGRIDSYIYPTPQAKRRLLGTSTTNIAKPHRREVHLSLDSFESTFRHELVHVLAGAFGMPILRISPSPALIEGLAVAVDWDAGDRTPHQFAASLFRFGQVTDVRSIFSFTGFAAKPSTVSYLLSGSFCRYLIEEYGLRRFIEVYPYAQFEKVYRISLEDLIEEWKEFLHSIEIPSTDAVRAKLLFSRPSIFSKVCARTVAELHEKAADMFREKEYVEASALFRTTYSMSNSREAALGLITTQFRLGKYDSVIAVLAPFLEDSTLARAYFPSKITLGDCYWILGQTGGAKTLYRDLRESDIGEAYNEAAAVRLESLRNPGFVAFMKQYLAAAGEDSSRIILLQKALTEKPEIPIARYLLGKLYSRREKYEAAIKELSKIKQPFEDPILNYQLEKTIGLSLLQTKDFQQAKVHLWQSLNYTKNEGDMNYIDDVIEFCDWLDEHRELVD